MKRGYLSEYFSSVAFKRLSIVETDRKRSNQHEFNGSNPLKKLFGLGKLADYPAQFVWLGGENEGVSEEGRITWYDAREGHPTRSEYRLYFRENPVMELASEGDLLIVARRPDKSVYIIVVEADTTLENQLIWLFGAPGDIGTKFNFESITNEHDLEVDFAVRYILEEIGLSVEEPEIDYLDRILKPYIETGFPKTSVFSELARKTLLEQISPMEDPDHALISWMEHEENLFKRLERHIVAERLENGFKSGNETDVDGFIKFSLSVQNRRKSRVGYALENHLEEIFKIHHVTYSRNKITENRSTPDFLFPDIKLYHDSAFPSANLTMLGVKSTCKDRWRQVLSEAKRIEVKHLFTLEPSISVNQTAEMQANRLQLVLPKRLHGTYKPSQQDWLMDLKSFVGIVKERQ